MSNKMRNLISTIITTFSLFLTLGLIAFSFKFPIFHVASELHCPFIRYLASAILIFIIGGLRMGLQGQFVSFSFNNYRISIFFLFLVILLTETGYLSLFYSEVFSFLGCVYAGFSFYFSPEVKEVLTLKALKLF